MTRPVRLLLIASSLWYFSEGLLGPLFAVFSEQIGGDVLDITAAWATYLIASGIAYPVVGRLLNRSRWKFRMIAVGYALNTVFTFAWGIARGHTQFISGVAIAIGGLIANFVSFQALFMTMGMLSLVATVVQVRLSFMEERIAV